MKYSSIREEELKNKVGKDWFSNFDTTEIIGNIDFSVFPVQRDIFSAITPLLWAEAKTGNYDIVTMFVQLILTIGKARTFDKILPPAFLGAFDFVKIAFVPYIAIQDIFYINDFNWNVAPSNHETKEFLLIKERIEESLNKNSYIFDYIKDEKELKFFIKNNIANARETSKIKINKNNFIPIYLKWLETIKPQISIDWENLRKNNILDCDFYLADLFVDDKNTQKIEDDNTIRDNLFVIYQNQNYKIAKENIGGMFDAIIEIKDKNIYQNFWKNYKRPPQKEYQDYIIEHRDLLVPQDIRERKGAFFTPRQWVELSQKYLTDYFGENWQDEYYIWDLAAGTGNLLAGLNNKYNIFASTLDQADVNVMHERIEHGANLLKNHCFQFDFLNDEFIPKSQGGKIPDELYKIISNEEKRKKLVIYINPPYAEATTAKTVTKTGENKTGTTTGNKTYEKYKKLIKKASNELFAQFLIRIYIEIPNSKIAEFSTLKILQSSNFQDFREIFRAKLEKIFLVPANTFDNVSGNFPIGFKIWNTEHKELFTEITTDIYGVKNNFIGEKILFCDTKIKKINKWIKEFDDKNEKNIIGFMENPTPDFQNNKFLNISTNEGTRHNNYLYFQEKNLIQGCIYFSTRHCIEANWLNDRDQFLFPKDGWQTDKEFQSDCLAFTLFHGQNRIISENGINHWIPFKEAEVNAPTKFASNFMTNFMEGKLYNNLPNNSTNSVGQIIDNENNSIPKEKIIFSFEAMEVFNTGRELWKYYFDCGGQNTNVSLYEIREFFQGRNEKGRMNTKSNDKKYSELITNLREKLKILAQKIQPKVFEYEFLRK